MQTSKELTRLEKCAVSSSPLRVRERGVSRGRRARAREEQGHTRATQRLLGGSCVRACVMYPRVLSPVVSCHVLSCHVWWGRVSVCACLCMRSFSFFPFFAYAPKQASELIVLWACAAPSSLTVCDPCSRSREGTVRSLTQASSCLFLLYGWEWRWSSEAHPVLHLPYVFLGDVS